MYTPERNPFEVLGLDPAATEEEVVRRAGQLRRRAGDEAALAELRRAVQALTGRAEDRLLQAFFTHPRPGHAAPALERLAAAHRRPPAGPAAVPDRPALDLADFARHLAAPLADGLEDPKTPFEPVAPDDEPGEVARQGGEALWQSLTADPRA
jgi:hypothetical protein